MFSSLYVSSSLYMSSYLYISSSFFLSSSPTCLVIMVCGTRLRAVFVRLLSSGFSTGAHEYNLPISQCESHWHKKELIYSHYFISLLSFQAAWLLQCPQESSGQISFHIRQTERECVCVCVLCVQ